MGLFIELFIETGMLTKLNCSVAFIGFPTQNLISIFCLY